MRYFLRSLAAIVAGFVAATIVMMCVETLNGRLLYPALGKAAGGVTDREALRVLMADAPVGALLVVILGWALGAFAGAWVAARIAGRSPIRHALVVGGVLVVAGIANNLMLPPPVWFWIASLAVLLPAAYRGGQLAARRQPGRSSQA
jgi:hypothetical protein